MIKNSKYFLVLIVMLLFLSLSVVSASDNSTTDTTKTIEKTTYELEKASTGTQEKQIQKDNKIINKNDTNKNIKTEAVSVNDYATLHDTLTSATSNNVTINLENDITLEGNTTVNGAIFELTIYGNNKTINGNSQYQFLNIPSGVTANIINATVTNCKADYGGAIQIYNGCLNISDCIFTNNSAATGGGAIYNSHTYVGELNNCTFSYNSAGVYGGALYNCKFANMLLTGNSFFNNTVTTADGCGGAICNDEYSFLNIRNNTFFNNTIPLFAGRGSSIYNHNISTVRLTGNSIFNNYAYYGAVYTSNAYMDIANNSFSNNEGLTGAAINTYLGYIITITNNTFINNTSNQFGGSISTLKSNMTIVNNTFTNNNAGWYGAAIYNQDYSNLTVTNNIFTNNRANESDGAIGNSMATMNITSNIFINNTSDFAGAVGNGYRANMTLTNNTFINNNASMGGAVGMGNGNMNITDNTFTNNTASEGGVIFNYGYTMNLNNNTFTNNTASVGGVIFNNEANMTLTDNVIIENSANENGAAVVNHGLLDIINSTISNNYAVKSGSIYNNGTLTIQNSIINNNTANGTGGAINNSANLTLIDTILSNNTSDYGGTISNDGVILLYNSTFADNYAEGNGGAIYIYNGTVTINNTTFTNNTSNRFGGSIDNCGTLAVTNSIFTDNNGYWCGGIYNEDGNLSIFNITFTNNTSNSGAGALYNMQGSANVTNCIFNNNNALMGGVIYNSGLLNIYNSAFNNNTAKLYGGVMENSQNTINIYNCTFNNNLAQRHGGVFDNSANLNIHNSTFNNNTANLTGSVVMNIGELTITNSILSNNTAKNFSGAIENKKTIVKIENTEFNYNNMPDFIIKDNVITSNLNNSFTVGNFTIITDKDQFHGSGNLDEVTIPSDTKFVKLILDGNDSSTLNNTFLIRNEIREVNVTGYQALVDMIEEAKVMDNYIYIINLLPGDYNATQNITWNNSLTTRIIIKGNTNTLDGKNTYQFIQVAQNNNLTLENITITNYTAQIGGAIENNGNITITQSNLNNNTATDSGAAIYSTGDMNLKDSNITNNKVTGTDGYVIDFTNSTHVSIIDNIFTNNTDNSRDMLFSDAIESVNLDIHGNTYTENYLEVNITGKSIQNITFSDNRTIICPVNITTRAIYNTTINTGNITVKSDAINTKTPVQYNMAIVEIENSQLLAKDNNLVLEYESPGRNYQTGEYNFTIHKLIPTYLTLELSHKDNVSIGETVKITVTLEDNNRKGLTDHEISIYINDEKINLESNKTDNNGQLTLDYTIENYTINNISGKLKITAEHIESNETSYYESSINQEKTLLINQLATNIHITIDDNSTIEAEDVNVTIELYENTNTPISGETITYNVTDNNGNIIIENTNATTTSTGVKVTLPALPKTGYKINIDYAGNDKYSSSTESQEIMPDYLLTQLKVIADDTAYINQTKEITIKLQDGNAEDIKGNYIIWIKVNDNDEYPVVITNGSYKFNQTVTNAAGMNITATFQSMGKYYESQAQAYINITPIPTKITYEIINNTQENIQINITVIDETTNTIIPDANIQITGDIIQNTTSGIITDKTLTPGEHSITVLYPETEYYQSSEISIDFKVARNDINMTIEAQSVQKDEKTIITIKTNDTLTDGTLEVYIEDTLIATITDLDSDTITITDIDTTNHNIGENKVTVKYTGSQTYNDITQEATLTILKRDITITAGTINITVDVKTANLTVTFNDTISDGTINVLLNNNIIGSYNITENTTSVDVIIYNTNIAKSPSNLTVQYTGSLLYNDAATNTTITTNKAQTNITIEPVTLNAMLTVNLTARITTDSNTSINEGKVVFKVNGKTVKDANGKVIYANVVNGTATVEYNIPENLAGQNITITATYTGTTTYNQDTTNITAFVTNKTETTPTLTITPITGDVQTASNITLKAKVTADNNPVTTGKIVFKINGKTLKDSNGKVIYAQVDSNGEVSVDYNLGSLKAGTYTIVATFIASDYKLTDNTTMTVIKA